MPLAFRGGQNALQAIARSAFFIACFSGAIFFFSPATHAGENCGPSGQLETVSVSHVYDGDTVKLADGRRLRLIGVNATEIGHGGKPDQPLAVEASRVVHSFVDHGGQLQIMTDRQTSDHYGRLLAHLFDERGDNLEQQLLEQGLAYQVAVPPNLTLAECLFRAQQRARQQGLGLWGPRGIAPVAAQQVVSGGYQRIQGVVSELQLGATWRLILDGHLIAITYPEHQANFDRHWYESLKGRRVEVRGWVYRSRGEWRIKLETPYAIELL